MCIRERIVCFYSLFAKRKTNAIIRRIVWNEQQEKDTELNYAMKVIGNVGKTAIELKILNRFFLPK